MDSRHFDALVKSLATSGSRRRLLGGLVAGFGLTVSDAAAAKRGRHQARPHRRSKRCPPGRHDCPAAGGTACVDVQTDPANCGACGRTCGPRQTCQQGVCSGGGCTGGCGQNVCGSDGCGGTCGACEADATCCHGQCVNGDCCGDADCGSGQRCRRNHCVCDATSCPNGCCDETTCRLGTDDDACGRNGQACKGCQAPKTCGGGGTAQQCGCTPATQCPAGQTCGTAPDGCGGTIQCGTCDASQCLTCGAGATCVSTCSGDTDACCGGTCTNLNTDVNNCGACGNKCAGDDACVAGTCGTICTEDVTGCPHCICFSKLDGSGVACVDICGSCANTCSADNPCGPGLVCVVSPCCGHPAGVGVCNPPCASEICACAAGAAACALGEFKACGPQTSAARSRRPVPSEQSAPAT